MSGNFVVQEIIELLKPEDIEEMRTMIEESGVVDYLDGTVSEAAEAADVSSVVDLDGLKEVLNGFIPPFEDIAGDIFEKWFHSLLGKKNKEIVAEKARKEEELLKKAQCSKEEANREESEEEDEDEESEDYSDEDDSDSDFSWDDENDSECDDEEWVPEKMVHKPASDQKVRGKKKKQRAPACNHDDDEVKRSIIAKFSYMDKDEYKKEHRPYVPTDDNQRLMVRYKDNEVVSTRGDRFAEKKKPVSDEIKRTFVHIGQYRRFKKH